MLLPHPPSAGGPSQWAAAAGVASLLALLLHLHVRLRPGPSPAPVDGALLFARLEQELAVLGRGGAPLTFAWVSLRHDAFDGDALADEVATRLAALCDDGALVARTRPREVALLLPGAGEVHADVALARVRESLAELFPATGGAEVAIGAVTCLARPRSRDIVLQRAFQLAYEGARSGRRIPLRREAMVC